VSLLVVTGDKVIGSISLVGSDKVGVYHQLYTSTKQSTHSKWKAWG
jgi:hypothetical protein